MSVKQFFYRIIYNPLINYVIRNISVLIKPLLKIKFRIPPSGILYLRTDSGTIRMATNQTSYLTQILFWNGYKKFEYSSLFEALAKDITYFFDIGSNIGYYSLLGTKANPNLKTYAFEPALGPKYYLKKNITLNNLENSIHSIDLALSNKIGTIDFYEVANKKYHYLKYNLAGEGNAGTKTKSRNFIKNEVKSTTLEEFINSQNLDCIDLIKIDTEGTEVDILNSGKEALKKYQPIIICETLFNTIEDDLEIFFSQLNYQMFNHTEYGLVKVKSIRRDIDDGIRNCFFVPESKLNLISKFIV